MGELDFVVNDPDIKRNSRQPKLWIARDKDNTLCIYSEEPKRVDGEFFIASEDTDWDFMMIDSEYYLDVNWENSPKRIYLGHTSKV